MNHLLVLQPNFLEKKHTERLHATRESPQPSRTQCCSYVYLIEKMKRIKIY